MIFGKVHSRALVARKLRAFFWGPLTHLGIPPAPRAPISVTLQVVLIRATQGGLNMIGIYEAWSADLTTHT